MQLDLRWIAVDTPEGFEPAFATIVRERANALFVMNSAVNFRELRRIADFAIKRRLPSVCAWHEFAEAGGLLSYGSDYSWLQAAVYVNKILDGAKPGDLPFVQPTTFDLVINQRTARTLGLTIPQSLLLPPPGRADSVIAHTVGVRRQSGCAAGLRVDPFGRTAASEKDRPAGVGRFATIADLPVPVISIGSESFPESLYRATGSSPLAATVSLA